MKSALPEGLRELPYFLPGLKELMTVMNRVKARPAETEPQKAKREAAVAAQLQLADAQAAAKLLTNGEVTSGSAGKPERTTDGTGEPEAKKPKVDTEALWAAAAEEAKKKQEAQQALMDDEMDTSGAKRRGRGRGRGRGRRR